MDLLLELWPHLTALVTLAMSVVASAHAILRKREVRASIGWVGLIWLAPVVGAVLYVLLGINRIRRRAGALQRGTVPLARSDRLPSPVLQQALGPTGGHLVSLYRLTNQVVAHPLLPGNEITVLVNGDAAYPAMVEAIDRAERTVTFSTYIFDRDDAGRRFLDAFVRAKKRGVELRILIDAVGLRYSFPAMDRDMRRAGLRAARFLPARVPWRMPYMNLRNHRKVLVVDGSDGFTGGMNVRIGHVLGADPPEPIQDVFFHVQGPVVRQLQEVFAEDWAFTTGERLAGDEWFPEIPEAGGILARAIADGPDEDFDKLRWTLLGAVACANHSVRIVTPYFLPDQGLVTALNVAAMRGVQVDVLLPEVNNLKFVQWAQMAHLWQVLEQGCRVFLGPPPFDHTKLMVVDRTWVHFGSANWDPRSLRLNFELDVECYDAGLAAQIDAFIDRKMSVARRVTLDELDARPLPVQLRDGIARLFTPYL